VKMLRKTFRLLLTLTLTFGATASIFAQDATPETPNEESATSSVYLPVVQAGQATAITEAETLVEDEPTATVDVVAADEVEAARSGGSGRCGDGGGGNNWGNSRGKLEVVGLTTDQRLICFDENDPRNANNLGRVGGLVTDTNLLGIDFRPATGELYGLGNAGGVYTLNLNNGQATLRSRLNVALSGSFFGVDFNPTVDRLRIISDNGQNLRANVDDGTTTTDVALNYPPPGANPATGIAGAAYTNNDADPNTATTLYDIDSVLDQVVIQSPANSGQLAPTGKLTVDTTADVGFDIYSTVRGGSTINVRGLASLVVGGQTRFYEIKLFTGKASLRGVFRANNQLIDIAIPLNQL
jgi:Domain of unknown function (DUF4394)